MSGGKRSFDWTMISGTPVKLFGRLFFTELVREHIKRPTDRPNVVYEANVSSFITRVEAEIRPKGARRGVSERPDREVQEQMVLIEMAR